jgi:hypothetical protein
MTRTLFIAAALLFASTAVAQDPEDGLTDAKLVGDPSTEPAPILRPQLVAHDRTTPIVIGATSAIVGGIGLVSAWSVYVARNSYRLTPRTSISRDTISSWQTQGAWSFWLGAGSSALLVASEYLLLPESTEVPTLGWFAGGAGLIVAAVGVGYAVGGTHCSPTAVRPGADIYLACSSMASDQVFGDLLIFSSLPLLNVPLTYLLRKAFAGAPDSLSIGPGSLQVRGRF